MLLHLNTLYIVSLASPIWVLKLFCSSYSLHLNYKSFGSSALQYNIYQVFLLQSRSYLCIIIELGQLLFKLFLFIFNFCTRLLIEGEVLHQILVDLELLDHGNEERAKYNLL